VITWLGQKILDAITPLRIRRQMWVIKRLMERLDSGEGTRRNRRKWLLQKEESRLIYRLVDDLWELCCEWSVVCISDGYRYCYYRAEISLSITVGRIRMYAAVEVKISGARRRSRNSESRR